jgi:hypothetical protein
LGQSWVSPIPQGDPPHYQYSPEETRVAGRAAQAANRRMIDSPFGKISRFRKAGLGAFPAALPWSEESHFHGQRQLVLQC